MDISRSVSKTLLTIFSFVVLTACNTANQEAALTMVVQTMEARGTGTAEIAEAIAPTATPQPQDDHIVYSSKDGMELVFITAGEFTMGSEDGGSGESPAHTVTLDAFRIDRFEVTNAMYRLCVEAGACPAPSDDENYNNRYYEDHPVVHVRWEDANAYCTWAGRRLPTEAEWEKAARGTDERTYPWGERINSTLANYYRNVNFTTVVGSYPNGSSPYGVMDMAGNAEEWVADWWDSDYYSYSNLTNPTGPDSGEDHVLRGGSWYLNTVQVSTTSRGKHNPGFSDSSIGFRCASSPHIETAVAEAPTRLPTMVSTSTVTPTPTLDPQDITYLADMTPIFVAAFRDTFWVRQIGGNMPYEDLYTGDPLTGMDGTVYENGLYIVAGYEDEFKNYHWLEPSILIYYLNGEYSSFRTTLALQKIPDLNHGCSPGKIFSIYLDDVKVYESPRISVHSSSIDIEIDVTGVSRLKLQTENTDNNSRTNPGCTNAIWGDPLLVAASTDTSLPNPTVTDTPEPTTAVTNTPATTTGTIQGRVYWASSSGPVEGVNLILSDAEAYSDANGQFELAGLMPGAYSFNLLWKFDFEKGDTPCAGLDPTTMITGDWFAIFSDLVEGGNMLIAIQSDEVEIKAGESTTFDIVFTCSE